MKEARLHMRVTGNISPRRFEIHNNIRSTTLTAHPEQKLSCRACLGRSSCSILPTQYFSYFEACTNSKTMAHATAGAAALAASDAPTALSEYTKALLEHPHSPDYYAQRSTAFSRLKPPRYDLALKDAEYAVILGYKRAKREKIQAAQQRRVVALNGLGRYADAKYILTTMERWRPKDSKAARMEGDMWMAKLDSKLQNVPDSEKVVTVKECPEVEVPSEDALREQLKAQLNPDGSFKLDQTDGVTSTSTTTTNANGTKTNNGTNTPSSTTVKPSSAADVPKIRHEWYQNAQAVTITLYAKGVSKEHAEIDIKDDSVYISFPHPANPSSTYSFSLDPLFALIDPSQSKAAILSTKIELTLRKVQQGQKWHSLEGTAPLKGAAPNDANTTKSDTAKAAVMSTLTDSQPSQTAASTAAVPTYPTSSRHGPKDWDKLANQLHTKHKSKKSKKADPATAKENADCPSSSADEAGEDIDSDYETGDAVDGFFKKLYAGADPDTRRAMMKSFYESKGTALSTNWSEVGKGPVEEVKSKSDN